VRTTVVTGAASGMGAATAARLTAEGQRVITVDLHDADVVADLGTPQGRQAAVAMVGEQSGGRLDGLVTFAGLAGNPDRPGSIVASVNYFGTVDLLAGLQPLLALGDDPAAVAISSNSTTCQPGVPADVVEACLAGDETLARARADAAGSLATYPATKTGVAWWVRRHAPGADWAGNGIRLNAIAPGMIDTPMIAEGRTFPELNAALDLFPLPLGRAGRPEEIAALVAYLLGPDARFFCGSIVFCDGGTEALLRPDAWPSAWEIDVDLSAFGAG
jgi:NAD(P)-dependent dehydrogenase (short-subunit alcohol dehydrogenase family)